MKKLSIVITQAGKYADEPHKPLIVAKAGDVVEMTAINAHKVVNAGKAKWYEPPVEAETKAVTPPQKDKARSQGK